MMQKAISVTILFLGQQKILDCILKTKRKFFYVGYGTPHDTVVV